MEWPSQAPGFGIVADLWWRFRGRNFTATRNDELVEAITHLAFHAGRPDAMSAIAQLKDADENSVG
ncbi:hypothetical protein [Streptomyces sp. NPDC001820]|uniref:hypothetical protein n=1 Tax=Streptomyces sp. NPDC001820 TaxID=3364613 RepID=UPI00368B2224